MFATIESQRVIGCRCLADQPLSPEQSHWLGVLLTSFLLSIGRVGALVLTSSRAVVKRMAIQVGALGPRGHARFPSHDPEGQGGVSSVSPYLLLPTRSLDQARTEIDAKRSADRDGK